MNTDDDKKSDGAARTRGWRERKRQKPGGQTQVLTWVPREYAAPLREVFARLGDPDWPGAMYRRAVAHWLHRRRPAPMRAGGVEYTVEIDSPEIDSDVERLPAGGRILGPEGTLIELTAREASELHLKINKAVDQAARDFLKEHGKGERLEDFTGVLSSEALLAHARVLPLEFYENRPDSDEQFSSSEAARFAQVFDTRGQIRIVPVDAGLFEVAFPGTQGLPSRCLAFAGLANDPDRGLENREVLALIGLPQAGGTPPTLVFSRIVDAVKGVVWAHNPQAEICLLDVAPDQFSVALSFRIAEVVVPNKANPDQLTWTQNPRLTLGLQRSLRESVEVYELWRRRGRLTAEEGALLTRLDRGEFD